MAPNIMRYINNIAFTPKNVVEGAISAANFVQIAANAVIIMDKISR